MKPSRPLTALVLAGLFVACGWARGAETLTRPQAYARAAALEALGRKLFFDPALSASGQMACASCHPDGRADGLSWRIEKRELQTPLLAGRLVGTHPFKWDGGDPAWLRR